MGLVVLPHRGRRWPGKTGGAIGFALNFLWLLSFFQEKESNNATIRTDETIKHQAWQKTISPCPINPIADLFVDYLPEKKDSGTPLLMT